MHYVGYSGRPALEKYLVAPLQSFHRVLRPKHKTGNRVRIRDQCESTDAVGDGKICDGDVCPPIIQKIKKKSNNSIRRPPIGFLNTVFGHKYKTNFVYSNRSTRRHCTIVWSVCRVLFDYFFINSPKIRLSGSQTLCANENVEIHAIHRLCTRILLKIITCTRIRILDEILHLSWGRRNIPWLLPTKNISKSVRQYF